MIGHVIFDGIVLSDHWAVVNIERAPSAMNVTTQTIPGRPGAMFMSTQQGMASISFVVLVKGRFAEDRRDELLKLRSFLQTMEPRWLEFSDDGGKRCKAILKSIKETRYCGCTAWQVTMTVPDPHLYAAESSSKTDIPPITTQGWGGRYLYLESPRPQGTDVIYPKFTLLGAVPGPTDDELSPTPGAGGCAEILVNDRYLMRVQLPDSDGHTVVIDCDPAVHSVTIDGAQSMLTLDSVWADIDPRSDIRHRVTMTDGGCTKMTVTWTDRWVI